MPEFRIIEVKLPNGKCLQFSCLAKVLTCELLTDVCQILNLKERNYFGLTYLDDKGYEHWLEFEKKILEHELPKRSLKIELFFKVRFFIEKFQFLTDLRAIQLIYEQLKSNLLKDLFDIKDEGIFELCALILQQEIGNFISINESKTTLRKLKLISTSMLSKHPSLTYCEDRVICYHEQLIGHTYGSSLINFISIIENLPSYGFHFFFIKDKNGVSWWLGVGFKGIALFDKNDKLNPRKLFEWRFLENLSFREKKFIAEIREQKKSNSFSGKLNVKAQCRHTIVSHVWTLVTSCLAKTVWMMSVNQHQFYLDRKQLWNTQRFVWNLQCLVKQLDILKENDINSQNYESDKITTLDNQSRKECIKSTSLEEMFSSNSTPNLSMLTVGKNQMTIKDYDSVKSVKAAECERLKLKKSALEELLTFKLQMLKEICLKEAELTGKIPIEYPQNPGEEIPKIRKRRGTSFAISQRFLTNDILNGQDFEMVKHEMEFEVQDNRTAAILKLAQNTQNPKNIRKKHRSMYLKEYQKLKELEEKINKMRASKGQSLINRQQNSIEDLSEDSREFLDEDEEIDVVPATSPIKSNSILRNSFRNKSKRNIETYSTSKDMIENLSLYHESSSDNLSLNSLHSHNQSINSDQSMSNNQVEYKIHKQLQESSINNDESTLNQVGYRVLPKKKKVPTATLR